MAKKIQPIRTYQWDPPSLITRLDVRKQDERSSVAYIYADLMHEDLAHLHRLRELFSHKGWVTSSDTRNGQSVLRLTGIKDENELISVLQSGEFAKGALHVSQAGAEKKQGIWQAIKDNSLRSSGIFYTLGNAFYVLCGLFGNPNKRNYWQAGTGVAFGLGDSLLAVFGGKDDNKQFKSLLTKLKTHLKKEGIKIPKNTAIYAETNTQGDSFSTRISNFIHEHINKFKAGAEVLGGIMYFNSGRTEKPSPNRWKQATAVIFTLGFGSTLFIKEKKPDKEKLKNAGWWEKTKAFVQEKPLRLGGWSGLSNTLFTTIGAFRNRSEQMSQGINIYKYDLAAAGSMLVGNNLYAISNKTTGGSITEEGLVRDIYGIAAQVLNHVPQDEREKAIKSTIDFLGERVEIKGTREEIDTLLRAQMILSQDNPWFRANSNTPPPPADQSSKAREVKFTASLPGKDGRWGNFVSQPVTHPVVPSK